MHCSMTDILRWPSLIHAYPEMLRLRCSWHQHQGAMKSMLDVLCDRAAEQAGHGGLDAASHDHQRRMALCRHLCDGLCQCLGWCCGFIRKQMHLHNASMSQRLTCGQLHSLALLTGQQSLTGEHAYRACSIACSRTQLLLVHDMSSAPGCANALRLQQP